MFSSLCVVRLLFDHIDFGQRHLLSYPGSVGQMISGILLKIGIFRRHPVYRNNNLQPPERSLTGCIEHGTVSSCSYDHHCLDALSFRIFSRSVLKNLSADDFTIGSPSSGATSFSISAGMAAVVMLWTTDTPLPLASFNRA